MRRLIAALSLTALPLVAGTAVTSPAFASEPPNVVADIAPIRSLVAQIMDGAGSPSQIIPTGASPHSYAMRPSEARALQGADLVVWVGPALTHWLEEPLDTLARDALRLTLMDSVGTRNLPMRAAETLEQEGQGHSHDHDHDHATANEDGHGHDHAGDTDPHGWLDPANAVLWGAMIAAQLAELDPDNADLYQKNWAALRDEVEVLMPQIAKMLAGAQEKPFIVLHDSFHYFEVAFGIEAQSFVIPGDGSTPGPARLKALRDHLVARPAVCAFTEPQENDALLQTAIEGQGTRVTVLDPMGDGQMRYADLMRGFAKAMAECLTGNQPDK